MTAFVCCTERPSGSSDGKATQAHNCEYQRVYTGIC